MTNEPAYLSDPQRLQVLAESGLMDSMAEPVFDRFVRLASRITNSPTALVSLVDGKRQFFKAHTGLGEPWATARQTPLSHSFCQHVVTTRQPLIVEDARQHPLVKDNLAISEIGVESYLGTPIEIGGECIGSLCVIDGHARPWSEEDVQALADLAGVINTEMVLRAQKQELQVARDQAESAHKRTADFLSRANHELRTPLQGVLSATEMACLEPGLEGRALRLVESACSSAKGMLSLIEDISHLYRLGNDPQEDQLEVFGLWERLTALKAQSSTDEREVGLVLGAGLEGVVQADWSKIRQILDNLLQNALRYTDGPVELRAAKSGEDRLILEVADQGSGIAPEELETIFEPFHRLEEGVGGTGLGLPIARKLADLMDGRLTARSSKGHGSVFRLELPFTAPIHLEASLPRNEIAPLRSQRVLVVDDHELNLELFEFLLQSLGQQVTIANSGEEALRLVGETDFDLILLDLNMPFMSGYELFAQIPRRPGQRIFAMSAGAVVNTRRQANEAGFDGTLPKPVSRLELSRVLAED